MIRYAHVGMAWIIFLGMSAHPSHARDSQPLDIEDCFNYDLWISNAEAQHAQVSNKTVAAVFGHHSISFETGRSHAFQDQVGGTHVGMPNDGRISKARNGITWNFQICTNRGTLPPGGYSNASLPRRPNTMYQSTQGAPPATNRIDLLPSQRGCYAHANLLFNGGGNNENIRYTRMYARYEDNTVEQVFGIDSVMPATYQNGVDNTTNVVAYTCTRHWGQSGSTTTIRDGTRYLHMLADPLTLNPAKQLVGLDVVVRSSGINRYNHLFIYAVSAIPATQGSVLLVY